mgnify:CR=1 FL=1
MENERIMAEFFKALCHPQRMRIVGLLKEKKSCVCDIAGMIRQPQPQVSRSLNILKKAGIVAGDKKGKRVCYRLKSPGITGLIKAAEKIIMAESKNTYEAFNGRLKGGKTNGTTHR